MKRKYLLTALVWLLLACLLIPLQSVFAQDEQAEVYPGHAARKPQTFAIIFNYGYAGDHFPKDKEQFEKVILGAKDAGFNTILCKWEDWRGEICKQHGMKIFVDLLAPGTHVYKDVEACQKLCESLKDNPAVYGYHIWSDNIGNTYPGRSRDVKNVHTWDPTHPVYVGTYRMSRVSRVEDLDLLGYYDFQWTRGGHWDHLQRAMEVAKQKDASFLRYCDATPGKVGVGNANRAGWTIATSIPFGLKGYLYHYGGGVVNQETGELDTLGNDLKKVNAGILPLGPELMKLGNPTALYSTTVTKTNKDRATGSDTPILPGLPGIPEDNWFQISAGEVVIGLFKVDGKDVLVAASHNAYQQQAVTLKLASDKKRAEIFDPTANKWQPLPIQNGSVQFDVAEFAPTLVRFD